MYSRPAARAAALAIDSSAVATQMAAAGRAGAGSRPLLSISHVYEQASGTVRKNPHSPSGRFSSHTDRKASLKCQWRPVTSVSQTRNGTATRIAASSAGRQRP